MSAIMSSAAAGWCPVSVRKSGNNVVWPTAPTATSTRCARPDLLWQACKRAAVRRRKEALKVLRSTLDDFIRTGPTEKELKASQQNITGGFPLRLSSNRKIIGNLAMIAFYDLPLDYLKTFSKQVRRLKAQQIQAAFSRRLFPERMVVVTVGPPLAQ